MSRPVPDRAEHIGSLKRPQELLQKRSDFQHGRIKEAELRSCEDRAIRDVVDMQLRLGLTTITDGEFRRDVFFDGFFDRLDGLSRVENPPESMFQPHSFVRRMPVTYIATRKLRRTVPIYVPAFEALKRAAGPENTGKLKVTLCPPELLHLRHGSHAYREGVYANDEEFFADIARIYREEIKDLYAHGCRKIQIDDPLLSTFFDERFRALIGQSSIDPDKLFASYLKLLNDCVRDRPPDLLVGLHLCRGNIKLDGTPFTHGSYDRIAAALFTQLNVDCYYLEYDTVAAGGFACLRTFPKSKFLVLGLVSTKTPVMESCEDLRSRLIQAAKAIAEGDVPRSVDEALNQLCLSPQCGFASIAPGLRQITNEVEEAKLNLVVETATLTWGTAGPAR